MGSDNSKEIVLASTDNHTLESGNAYMYIIECSGGVMDYVHGHTETITEFYVPCYNLTFNAHNDQLNCFFLKRVPKSYKMVTVSDDMIDDMYAFTRKKGKIAELIPEIRNCFVSKELYGTTAHLYEHMIYEDMMDFVHSGGSHIKEMHIPDYNLTCNVANGVVNVFKDNRKPENYNIVKINDDLASTLNSYCKQKDKINLYVADIKKFGLHKS